MPLADYEIIELTETLERLEQELITLSKVLEKGQSTAECVHLLFRFAHNLKGSLAMVHKQSASTLIHAMETSFDIIRNGKSSPNEELIRLSLLAVDIIKQNLRDAEENKADMDDLKELFQKNREACSGSVPTVAESGLDLKPHQLESLEVSIQSGYGIYLIDKPVRGNLTPEMLADLPVFEEITRVGQLFALWPDPSSDEFKNNSTKEKLLRILFISKEPEKELACKLTEPFHSLSIGEKLDPKVPARFSSQKELKVLSYTNKPDFKHPALDWFHNEPFSDPEALYSRLQDLWTDHDSCDVIFISGLESTATQEVLLMLNLLEDEVFLWNKYPPLKVILCESFTESEALELILNRADLLVPIDSSFQEMESEKLWIIDQCYGGTHANQN